MSNPLVVPSTGDPLTDPLFAYRGGSTEPWTVDVICMLMRALGSQTVLETGSFEGRSTRQMAETNPQATIYSVELDTERHLKAVEYCAGLSNVVLSNMDAISAMQQFADGTTDFIFLDDDHDALHVALEVKEAMRLLRSGGVCVVHDVHGPFRLDAIVHLANGICLPFARMHKAGGLGIIVKP